MIKRTEHKRSVNPQDILKPRWSLRLVSIIFSEVRDVTVAVMCKQHRAHLFLKFLQ